MTIKKPKRVLPDDLGNELMKISKMAPIAPPPDRYLISIYEMVSKWKKSGGWKENKKVLTKYRRKNLTKQTKKSQFGTIIAITAPGVKPSSKSKYITILRYALNQKMTTNQLKDEIKKYGINGFVDNVRKKSKGKKSKGKKRVSRKAGK